MWRELGHFLRGETWIEGVSPSCGENVCAYLEDNSNVGGWGVMILFSPDKSFLEFNEGLIHSAVGKACPCGFSFHAVVVKSVPPTGSTETVDPSIMKKKWGMPLADYMSSMWVGEGDLAVGHVTVPANDYLQKVDEVGGVENLNFEELMINYPRGIAV